MSHALASCTGRNLQAIAAKLHAALSLRSFFARVMKMEYTVLTLANPVANHIGEQPGGAMCQRGE